MRRNGKRVVSLLIVFSMLIGILPISKPAEAAVGTGPVVIYEAYGGGGNTGATLKNDYIVLKNISEAAVSLDGWAIQYASKTGGFSKSTALTGTVAAGGYYLIQQNNGSGGTEDLPPAQAVDTISMSGTAFKLALTNTETAATGPDGDNVVDFVGAGSGVNQFLGTGLAPSPSNKNAIQRVAYTGDNAADFQTVTADLAHLSYLTVAPPEESSEPIDSSEPPQDSSSTPTDPPEDSSSTPVDPPEDSSSSSEAPPEESSEEPPIEEPPVEEPTAPPTYTGFDPIPAGSDYDLVSGATNIAGAKSLTKGAAVSVFGQVVYKFGNNTVIIQDVISGQVEGISIYGTMTYEQAQIGDVIQVTGKRDEYNALPQISSVTEVKKLTSTSAPIPAEVKPMPAQVVDAATLQKIGLEHYVNEYVVIKNATLGAGTLTDASSPTSVSSYRPASYPSDLKDGDQADVYGAYSRYKDNGQMRVGWTTDYLPVGVVKIQAARDQASGSVKTQGVVTWTDGKDNVTIQDDTAGIAVYARGKASAFNVGDLVVVEGARGAFRDLQQITYASHTVRGTAELPAAQTVTIADLINTNVAEKYESERVYVEKATLGAVNLTGNTPISQQDSTINVFRANALPEGVVEGDVVNVTAILSQYNDYQLRILKAEDVVKVEGGTTPTDPTEPTTQEDPIQDSEVPTGVYNIKETLAQPDDTIFKVIGQITYIYGGNSVILQDVIDGEIWGYQVFGLGDNTAKIGDVVVVEGKKINYYSVPEHSGVVNVSFVDVASTAVIQPQTVTISAYKANHTKYMNELLKFENVTLPEHKADGSIAIKDATGSVDIYHPAAYPIGTVAGDKVHVIAAGSAFSGNPQVRNNDAKDYIILNDTVAPIVTIPALAVPYVNQDYAVGVTAEDNVGVEKVELDYTVGAGTVKTIGMALNTVNGRYEATIPAADIVSGSLQLTIRATDVNGLVGTATTTLEVDDKPQVEILAPMPGSATKENKRPEIRVQLDNAGANPTAVMTLDGTAVDAKLVENILSYTPAADLADKKYEVTVEITRTEDGVKSQLKKWSFYVGEPTTGFYFGQIHSHSNYSDGSGTPVDAMNYAANEAKNLDWFALTDHSNYFDTKEKPANFNDPMSALPDVEGDPSHSKWTRYKQIVNSYQRDDFLPIHGFEMTYSNKEYGHLNVYNTNGIVSRNDAVLNATGGSGLQAFYAELEKLDPSTTFTQFNHPGKTFGNFTDFAYYTPALDKQIKLLEVGNGEGNIQTGNGYWPSYEQYTLALDKGWHLAPTNGQDNHKRFWGDSNTGRTVAIMDGLTKENLLDAINNYRIYSTEDHNFEIDFTANGQPMGTIFDAVPERLDFAITMNDPDQEPIAKVEIVVNGGVTANMTTPNAQMNFYETSLLNNYSYYYIRVTQTDGDIIVTAPVWTSAVKQVGIKDLQKDKALDEVNLPTTLTTTLFNDEPSDFIVTSAEYLYKGESVATVTEGLPTIATKTTADLTYAFSPQQAGVGTMQVVVKGTLDGAEMQFTRTIDLNVIDSSKMKRALVDAAHDNFYISGNYAGSYQPFVQLAAQMGILVEQNTAPFTDEVLTDVDLLILTVPFAGANKAIKPYTAEELDAIARYAANGGNIVVTSKSDRFGPPEPEQAAAAISNSILEKIGAKARIVDGIAVDNDKKSNEAYRIPLTGLELFNQEDPLMAGIADVANPSYTLYNGTGVLANGTTVLVSGYPTTWGASYAANFSGSAYVPNPETDKVTISMGDVDIVTTETLPGGGFAVVAGTTFFSNYDVTAEALTDVAQRNANYILAKNVLEKAAPVVISPIADVHAEPNEGIRFTVEGTLTSNASGFDKETAFFDSVYLQDETAGINLFPVAGEFQAGQKVRVTGTTSSYQGERQIEVESIELISEEVTSIAPQATATGEVKNDPGRLMQITGVVQKVVYTDNLLEGVIVDDGTGPITVFIDGYINPTVVLPEIKEGDTLTAVGLSSESESAIPTYGAPYRLRVRDRNEITVTPAPLEPIVLEKNGVKIVIERDDVLANVDVTDVELVVELVPYNMDGMDVEAYEIHFLVNGEEMPIATTVRVELPETALDVTKVQLFHVVDGNAVEHPIAEIVEGRVVFFAESFSVYLLAAPVAEDSSEPGQDSSEPGQDSSEPGQDSSEPGQDSSEPGQDSSEPGQDSSEPGQDSSEPGQDSSETPVVPVIPTEPTDDSSAPDHDVSSEETPGSQTETETDNSTSEDKGVVKPSDKSPKTGDGQLMFYALILFLGVASFTLVMKKREEERE